MWYTDPIEGKGEISMKKFICMLLAVLLLAGCTAAPAQTETAPAGAEDRLGEVRITLSDESIGIDCSTDDPSGDIGVYTDRDIIYYEAGHDESYGEGEPWQAHTAEEAGKHIVVHITKPGVYRLTGKLPFGQIAVDLGEEAKDDPDAVVTLILDNVDINCDVAPAIIFYNVYECGGKDDPKAQVDTSAAGANVVLANGSVNTVRGSHVAKIYQPGTEEKLHKYDGAFYSRMSMNIDGNDGVLNIQADNEGLGTELHLTINGGEISIESGNDGINTNEDGVSVTTINGGRLRIDVAGTTGEGDGIDSNGWLIINGGVVEACACGVSGDAGVDADMGVQINGGTVMATGNMLDPIDSNSQTHLVFTFAQTQTGLVYTLKDPWDSPVLELQTSNDFRYLVLSSPELAEGNYTLWSGDTQFEGAAGGGGGHFGGGQIIDRPDWPDKGEGDVEIPPQPTNPVVTHGTVQEPPAGDRPADMPVPPMDGQGGSMPMPSMPEGAENMPMPQLPDGVTPPEGGRENMTLIPVTGVLSTDFPVKAGANYFTNVKAAE